MAERWKLTLVLVAIVATLAIGETAIARGMKQAGAREPADRWSFVRASVTNPWVLAGGALLSLHLLIYAVSLSELDLSLVMPITAASYPVGTLLARYFLQEEVNMARWTGTAIIALGVAVVAWGESTPGP